MRYVDETQIPAISDEEFAAELAKVRPYTICILKTGPSFEMPDAGFTTPIAKIIFEHGRRNTALRLAGVMPIVCPIGDGGSVTGVCVLDATLEEAERILSRDPAVMAGVLTYELHATQTFPGSTLSTPK